MRLLHFVAMIALALMPIGMASAPAAAHSEPTTNPVSVHCTDHQQAPEAPTVPAKAMIDCTLMCAALTAAEAASPPDPPLPERPLLIASATPIAGIEPDIGTPPPRS
jgi:hypothetical protein